MGVGQPWEEVALGQGPSLARHLCSAPFQPIPLCLAVVHLLSSLVQEDMFGVSVLSLRWKVKGGSLSQRGADLYREWPISCT